MHFFLNLNLIVLISQFKFVILQFGRKKMIETLCFEERKRKFYRLKKDFGLLLVLHYLLPLEKMFRFIESEVTDWEQNKFLFF